MDWIERIGLLKMDFLGLRNLTVMENAVEEIRRTVDAAFDLTRFRSTMRGPTRCSGAARRWASFSSSRKG